MKPLIALLLLTLAGCSTTSSLEKAEEIPSIYEKELAALIQAEKAICEDVRTGTAIQRYKSEKLRMAFITICRNREQL